MTQYALFKDGRQISKAHSTREAVLVEAYERGAVLSPGIPDFPGDPACETVALADGCDIKEVDQAS